MTKRRVLHWSQVAVLFAGILTLYSCSSDPGGSGGGIGGSGIISPGPDAGTGVSLGSIAAFGSVVVNGERFDTSSSEIVVLGMLADLESLRVGMRVRADVDFTNHVAQRIEYTPALVGPITRVTSGGRSLQVLGQELRVEQTNALKGLSYADLQPGRVIEASGARDAAGRIIATFLRLAPDPSTYYIEGPIAAVEPGATSIMIGGLRIELSHALSSGSVAVTPETGSRVLVSASSEQYDPNTVTLHADRLSAALAATALTGEAVELDGIVSTVQSPTRFEVGGQLVMTNPTTLINSSADLEANGAPIALNTRVEIEGVHDSSGAILANRIVIVPSQDSELSGLIESVDVAQSSFTLLGIEVLISPRTRIETEDDPTRPFLGIETLTPGERVSVEGAFNAPRLIAESIEREAPEPEASIEGPVTSFDIVTRSVEVMGIPLLIGPDTDFEVDDQENLSASEFLQQLSPGILVEASWQNFTSTNEPVDSLELESDEQD